LNEWFIYGCIVYGCIVAAEAQSGRSWDDEVGTTKSGQRLVDLGGADPHAPVSDSFVKGACGGPELPGLHPSTSFQERLAPASVPARARYL